MVEAAQRGEPATQADFEHTCLRVCVERLGWPEWVPSPLAMSIERLRHRVVSFVFGLDAA